jgi:polysaccharide pyruvyl transferase WcaK-like protein
MHTAIASLSGCTPVTAIAYSDKVQGIFDGCDLSDAVVDPRSSDCSDLVDRLMQQLAQRDSVTATLHSARTRWESILKEQTEHVVSAITK